jgi:hypothetical protein
MFGIITAQAFPSFKFSVCTVVIIKDDGPTSEVKHGHIRHHHRPGSSSFKSMGEVMPTTTDSLVSEQSSQSASSVQFSSVQAGRQ